MRSEHIYFLLLLILLPILPAPAQTATGGSLEGVVYDAAGARMAGLPVAAENLESGEHAQTATGAKGEFRFVDLRPGRYHLSLAARGFRQPEPLLVTVALGRVTSVAVHMAVAAARETVEVREAMPAVNTTQPDFAGNIRPEEIDNLPINGRRWSNFALLTPGAVLDGDYGLISFRGISGLLNNSTVDGADNNQAFFSEERGRTRISYVISQESVREFQVNTSNFSAEYGRAAGAVVNSVTRSGGDHWRGKLFYYNRDNEFGATNPFTSVTVRDAAGNWTTRVVKPADRRQQYGGSLGGPLLPKKVFYFVSTDWQRRDFPAVGAAYDPLRLFARPCVIQTHYAAMTAATRAQVQVCGRDELYTLTRNVMPLFSSDAAAIAAFNAGIDYLSGLLGEVPRTANHQIEFGKLDFRLTQRHGLSVSYNRARWNSPGGVQSAPVVNLGRRSLGNDGVRVDTVTARLNSVFSTHFISQLRYSWGRDFEFQAPQKPLPGEPAGANGYAPEINLLSGSSGFSFGTPATLPRRALPDEYRHELAGTVSWLRGKHLFKLGADANRVHDIMDNLYAANGAYNYYYRDNFIADYYQWMQGIGTQYQGYSSFRQGYGTAAVAFNTWDVAAFVQDEWRPARRLVLSLGLRYEREVLPPPQMANPALPASQTFPRDANNFGPRFGFAWDILGDGKMSLRGGYGMYYGRISNSTISSALTDTGMAAGQRSYYFQACYLYDLTCLQGPQFPNTMVGDPYSAAAQGDVAVFDQRMQTPQIHQMDLILERQVAHNTVLSVSGLLSLGRELPKYIDINLDPASRQNVMYTFGADYYTGEEGPFNGHTLTVPVYTARLNSNFEAITNIASGVNSVYSALVVGFNRHMTSGLSFRMHYTWSHAIDDGQSSQTFTTYNGTLSPAPFTYEYDGVAHTVTRPDYGTSNFDVRHRVMASLHWTPKVLQGQKGLLHGLLNHWTIAPIVQFHTGRPFSDYVSGNPPSSIVRCAGCLGFMGTGGQYRLPFLGRNSFRLGDFFNADLRLARRIHFNDRVNLEVLAEAFNVLNHRNITGRTKTMYTTYGSTLEYNSNFNTPYSSSNTVYRERELQLGARLSF